jgi:DNA-binding MarR family transcriptional regulator
MSDNKFFKPTILYKEYMILDMIEKNPNITQREIGQAIGIAVSMVNGYIHEYEQKGYVKRKYISTKTVEYLVTKNGLERRKVLNIGYLNASQRLYNSAKENIENFLNQIEEKGFRNILLYGAGEVAEILLNTIKGNKQSSIHALAIIDDDLDKVGNEIVSTVIISREMILGYEFDGILISSFTNKEKIKKNILAIDFDENQIIDFFN